LVITSLLLVSLIVTTADARQAPQLPPVWIAEYAGPDMRSDEAYQVLAHNDGSLFVIGDSYTGVTNGHDTFVIKYDADGTLLWVQQYDPFPGPSGLPARAALDPGGCLWVPMLMSSGTQRTLRIIRIDPNGNTIWTLDRPLVSSDVGNSSRPFISLTGSDAVVAIGDAGGYLVAGISGKGGFLWELNWSSQSTKGDLPTDLDIADDGTIYVTGWLNGTLGDYATLSLDPDGTLRWIHLLQGPIGTVLTDAHLRVHPDGGVVVSGSPETICGVGDTRTWRIDESGRTMWDVSFTENVCTHTRPVALDVAPDGRVVVVGGRPSNFGGFQILMYDAQGNRLWAQELVNPDAGATPSAVRFDADGGTVVVGSWQEISTMDAYGIVRLDRTGTPTWGWFGGESVNAGNGLSIDFDPAGRVVTAGKGWGGSQVGSVATLLLFDPTDTNLPADLDNDGDVDVADLLALLAAWDTPNGDLNGDGFTNVIDLLMLLAEWTP
jgi:hypothetical protein